MTISYCEEELNYFCKKIAKKISFMPEIIYHYTSSSAMLSILKNMELWFSNIKFLNDATENKYIYICLKNYINENSSKFNMDFCDKIIDFCQTFINNDTQQPYYLTPKIYVASFSLKEDELNLWNYYSKDKNHLGYNIGFNTQDFINYSNDGDLIDCFGQVIYGKDFLYEIFDKIIPNIYKIFINLDIINISMLLQDLSTAFLRFSMFFKDESFASEKEYRLVWNTDLQADIREYNGFYIPYQKYSIPVKSIKSFMISPTQNYNIAKLGMDELLNNHIAKVYANNITINKSRIPLRY